MRPSNTPTTHRHSHWAIASQMAQTMLDIQARCLCTAELPLCASHRISWQQNWDSYMLRIHTVDAVRAPPRHTWCPRLGVRRLLTLTAGQHSTREEIDSFLDCKRYDLPQSLTPGMRWDDAKSPESRDVDLDLPDRLFHLDQPGNWEEFSEICWNSAHLVTNLKFFTVNFVTMLKHKLIGWSKACFDTIFNDRTSPRRAWEFLNLEKKLELFKF